MEKIKIFIIKTIYSFLTEIVPFIGWNNIFTIIDFILIILD